MTETTLVWFRRDLRLADNPALSAAALRGAVVPVFIWSPDEEAPWQPGAASRWWLHHALTALRDELTKRGLRLVIRSGASLEVLRALARETKATGVCWNRLYEPAVIARDSAIKQVLRDDGLDVRSYNGALLNEPWEVLTQTEKPYQVFTPYHRACLARGAPSAPLAAPNLKSQITNFKSESVESLGLLPKIKWDSGLRAAWQPGEAGAQKMLTKFASHCSDYAGRRDFPHDDEGTSRLSPHLHFGELSPRQVWHAAQDAAGAGAAPFQRQLVWRDFAHLLLFHFPHTDRAPLRPEFRDFPWARNEELLAAWHKGRTGFPIVDAGMRELWASGTMHNRVRMIVASFLVKDLLIPWQRGAAWFWDTLVDADLANNSLGWQWTAGCGADAAPYFRIFNPASQAAKFDPQGAYIRRWLPELESWPTAWLHDAALAAPQKKYPRPVVDHAAARARALSAYRELRGRLV